MLMVDQRFYFEFEQRFRGSREDIGKRLDGYSSLLETLEKSGIQTNAVDYGCGRGEWLRLLLRRGWDAIGVDSNADMVKPAEEEGLKIEVGDAIAHIQGLPSNSVSMVTGFHIVEHLPAQVLLKLVAESFRVVRPGGIIIFETPNPENFLVGSNRFYLDPTHVHPLPPYYLEFVAEFSGFDEAVCIGVNAPPLRHSTGVAAAFLEFAERSPDYALIAQKTSPDMIVDRLSNVMLKYYPENTPFAHPALDRFIDGMHAMESRLNSMNDELQNLRHRLDDLINSKEDQPVETKSKWSMFGLREKIEKKFK